MTSVPALPQLNGRILLAYRAAWAVFAAAAAAALLVPALDSGMHPVIVALRLAKGATIIAVAVILLRRRQRDPVAALLTLAFLTWTVTSSFDFASEALLPLLLDRLRFLLFALALLLFPGGDWNPAWTGKVAIASVAVFLLGVAETLTLASTRLFLPLAIACVVASVASLIVRFRAAETEALRQQLRWVALGLVSGISLILLARAGDTAGSRTPSLDLPILWEAMFQTGVVAVALGFLVSLLRYRLYDAEVVISRSATYAALTVTLLTCFAASEGLIEVLGQRYLGSGIGDFSAAFAAAVAAVLLAPLHSRIDSWAEQKFQRDLVVLKREVPELLAELAASSSTRELGAAVLPRISEAVHATHSALFVNGAIVAVDGISFREAREWARGRSSGSERRTEPVERPNLFPVTLSLQCPFGRLSGELLIGPRPDCSRIGGDEIRSLNSLLPALRHALSSTTGHEAEKAAFDRRLKQIYRSIREIQVNLAGVHSMLPHARGIQQFC